jgi:hypothetical protein
MDFVRLPTSCEGQYNYLLTIMDYATRWLEAYPIRRATAAAVKRILLNDFIPKYGPGCTITSDQDRAFLSDVVKQLILDNDLKLHLFHDRCHHFYILFESVKFGLRVSTFEGKGVKFEVVFWCSSGSANTHCS